jgi:hypothetical protein
VAHPGGPDTHIHLIGAEVVELYLLEGVWSPDLPYDSSR